MADNYIFSNNGAVIPDTEELLETVQEEFIDALGQDLSLEESTPQGRLIDVEVTSRRAVINFNAEIANVLINISTSSGNALDAWGANFDVYRKSATSSSAPVTVTGVTGTVIPEGAQASTENGVIWLNESEIIIGENGSAAGTFICSNTGPVELGTGELTNIVTGSQTGLNGWETVTNIAPASLGADLESDEAYKARILSSIFSGSALFGNYASSCYKVENVLDVFAYDNPEDEAKILDNIEIPPHSVYICVNGGNSEDVAYALYEVKSAGCGWCGNTTVNVVDKTFNSTSSVTYQTPSVIPIQLTINVTSDNNSNENLENTIKETIVNYFNNLYQSENIKKIGIRAFLSPFIISSVLSSQISNIETLSVQIGLVTPAPHAVISLKKASITNGVTWASVNSETFSQKAENNGAFNFVFNGENWQLNGENQTLSEWGISIQGTPIVNDTLSVIYADGNLSGAPVNLFASETPSIDEENITVKINE